MFNNYAILVFLLLRRRGRDPPDQSSVGFRDAIAVFLEDNRSVQKLLSNVKNPIVELQSTKSEPREPCARQEHTRSLSQADGVLLG